MKIYVIRHGVTQLNKKKIVNGQIDEPLVPEGIEQAKQAISLIPKSVKYIYYSPLLRAKKTAEIIGSKLPCSTTVCDQLTEIHMGSLAGKAWIEMEGGLELKKKHRSVQFDYRKLGGESAKDVKDRILTFLKKINNKHSDYEALIITHGGIIRVLHLLEYKEQLLEEIEHISLITFDVDKILNNSIKNS